MTIKAGKKVLTGLVAIGASGLLASQAQATNVLQLSDGVTTINITDGAAGDLDARAGVIVVNQTVGVFDLNVTTGLTTPFLGSPQLPVMDLNSVNVSSGGAGVLTLKLTTTDFLGPLPGGDATLDAGGTTNGSIVVSSYIDITNTAFGEGTPTASLGVFTDGAFSGTLTSEVVTASPYSATIKAVITHDEAKDVSSFDGEFRVVPEPTSLALMGLGGLLLARRRRG